MQVACFEAKMHRIRCRSFPRPGAGFQMPTSKGREGEGRGYRRGKSRGERTKEGKEGNEVGAYTSKGRGWEAEWKGNRERREKGVEREKCVGKWKKKEKSFRRRCCIVLFGCRRRGKSSAGTRHDATDADNVHQRSPLDVACLFHAHHNASVAAHAQSRLPSKQGRSGLTLHRSRTGSSNRPWLSRQTGPMSSGVTRNSVGSCK